MNGPRSSRPLQARIVQAPESIVLSVSKLEIRWEAFYNGQIMNDVDAMDPNVKEILRNVFFMGYAMGFSEHIGDEPAIRGVFQLCEAVARNDPDLLPDVIPGFNSCESTEN